MRKAEREARRISPGRVAARLAGVLTLCLVVRAVIDIAGGAASGSISEGLGAGILTLALPGAEFELPGAGELALKSALPGYTAVKNTPEGQKKDGNQPSSDTADTTDPGRTVDHAASDGGALAEDTTPDTAPPVEQDTTGDSGPADTAPNDKPAVPETPQNKAIGTTIIGTGSGYLDAGGGIYIKNQSKYTLDIGEIIERPLRFSAADGAAVLIIHTHGSEAYNPAGEDMYEESDHSRTEDRNFNVVRVGDELEKVLTERGITVIHDRELYDYPSYTGSYDRSLASIKAHLKENPEIRVVIDLHRDALEGDGKLYKTVADVGSEPCAQVMLICGSNSSGLKHPDWQENLTFALKIQREMVTDYPTLARPLKISQYRYNQHATTGSLIVEVGTNGNTLREALNAVRYFGRCLADVLTEAG